MKISASLFAALILTSSVFAWQTGTPLFPNALFDTGGTPYSFVVADFNRNGLPDIATVNQYPSVVSILEGNGFGGFGTPTHFAVGTQPVDICAGDFNHDGWTDVATANQQGGVSVLIANGPASFVPATSLTAGTYTSSIVCADLNGDGVLDLAAANANSNTVSLFLGDGSGAFAMGTSLAVGSNPRWLVSGDLNHDGRVDLVTANALSGNVSVLLGNSVGGFAPATHFPAPGLPLSIDLGDLNQDGHLDAAVVSANSSVVAVLHGDGLGGFGAAATVPVELGPHSISIADVNSDELPDLLVNFLASPVSRVAVLLSIPESGFGAPTYFFTASQTQYVAAAEVSGDGALDLIAMNYSGQNISILVGDGSGGFATRGEHAAGLQPVAMVAADFNGDGQVDVATANVQSADVTVLLGNGAGSFAAPLATASIGQHVLDLAVGYLNYDTVLDLVVTRMNYVSVLHGMGDGTFAVPVNYSMLSGEASLRPAVADLNANGRSDIAIANRQGAFTILYNDGAGGYGPRQDWTAPNVYAVAIDDLDGDGRPDLIGSTLLNKLLVRLNIGFSSFGPLLEFEVGSRPESLATRDLNSDGKVDVVTANTTSADVSVLLGLGDGTFAPVTNYPVGGNAPGPTDVAVEDLNGDGVVDLAVTSAGGRVYVLLGNGDGTFRPPLQYATGYNPRAIAAFWMNADTRHDLVTANQGGGVSVLLNQGQLSWVSHAFCLGTDAWCPCEAGEASAGCETASGSGGVSLSVLSRSSEPNAATLLGQGYSPTSTPTAIVIRSPTLDSASPVVFGDGLRCIGTTALVRLAPTVAVGGTSTHILGHGAGAGPGTFYYQLWYRNTPASFCTPAAFNLSSGRTLNW